MSDIPMLGKSAYLDIVQLAFLHSFKMGDFRIHASYVIIDGILLIPTLILFPMSIIPALV